MPRWPAPVTNAELAAAREKLNSVTLVTGQPTTFALACNSLAESHVLPGIFACLEKEIGSPTWRWAAEAVLKYSQRQPGTPATPTATPEELRKVLTDPDVQAVFQANPDLAAQFLALVSGDPPPPADGKPQGKGKGKGNTGEAA